MSAWVWAGSALSWAAEPPVRLQTTGIEVVSDAGESSARALIDRVLEMRLAFPNQFLTQLKIFVLQRDQRFTRIRPHDRASAFFQRGSGENFIVLPDPAASRALRHEYVHFALDHSAVALPLWLEEGLAEYYSTLDVQRDQLVAGGAIPAHVAWVRNNGVPDLVKVMAQSGQATGEVYAVGWALVHMLRLAPDYKGHYGRFWQRLQTGERAEEILPQVFGRSLAKIAEDLAAYVAAFTLPTELIPISGPMEALSRVTVERLTSEEFEEHYLSLVRATGRMDEVHRLAGERAVRQGPGAQAMARALRAMAEHRLDTARREWERAIAAGLQRADAFFEYAGVLRDMNAPEAEVAAALAQVVALNPRFTPAHVWLASLEGRQSRWAEAERHLELAVAETPRRFEVWYELAFVRRNLDKPEAAREAATKALAVAATALDREKALALRESLAEAAAAPGPKAPVTVAKGWELPLGDKQVDGEWGELVCEQPAVLKLHVEQATESFIIRDPAKVTLRNTGSLSYEFQCGRQDPVRRVRIGFDSATGEVRVLEFLP